MLNHIKDIIVYIMLLCYVKSLRRHHCVHNVAFAMLNHIEDIIVYIILLCYVKPHRIHHCVHNVTFLC